MWHQNPSQRIRRKLLRPQLHRFDGAVDFCGLGSAKPPTYFDKEPCYCFKDFPKQHVNLFLIFVDAIKNTSKTHERP